MRSRDRDKLAQKVVRFNVGKIITLLKWHRPLIFHLYAVIPFVLGNIYIVFTLALAIIFKSSYIDHHYRTSGESHMERVK